MRTAQVRHPHAVFYFWCSRFLGVCCRGECGHPLPGRCRGAASQTLTCPAVSCPLPRPLVRAPAAPPATRYSGTPVGSADTAWGSVPPPCVRAPPHCAVQPEAQQEPPAHAVHTCVGMAPPRTHRVRAAAATCAHCSQCVPLPDHPQPRLHCPSHLLVRRAVGVATCCFWFVAGCATPPRAPPRGCLSLTVPRLLFGSAPGLHLGRPGHPCGL